MRDKKNIDPKKIFYNIGLTQEKTILISGIVIALRLILFLCVIFFVEKNIALNILLCIVLFILFAMCYEIARAKKSIFPVLFFVCFGYPLRFFAAQKGKNIKLQKNIMSFYVIKLMENYFWMEKEKFLMLGIGILFWQFFFCRWRFF